MRKALIFTTLLLLPTNAFAQDDAVIIELNDPGFEDGSPGSAPTGWGGTMLAEGQDGPGYRAVVDAADPAAGKASLKIASDGPTDAGKFGAITRSLDVEALRGRKIRLTGKARVGSPTPMHAGFWLRVDRPEGQQGFFDNMRDRRITSGEWQSYVIEGDVAFDASKIFYGFLVQGEGTAWVDDFTVEDIGPADLVDFEGQMTAAGPTRKVAGMVAGDTPAATISDRGISNLTALARLYGLVRWFHPSDQAAEVDWGRLLIGAISKAEAAENPTELSVVLREVFGPVAPTLQIGANEAGSKAQSNQTDTHVQWSYAGFPSPNSRVYQAERSKVSAADASAPRTEVLPGGIAITLPMSVAVDANGATLPASEAPSPDTGKPRGWVPAGFDRTTRLAGVISAWAMFDHFYPYWDVVDTDWDASLAPSLQGAAVAADDIAQRDVLLRLVEGLDDGHGGVNYRYEGSGALPLDWAWIEDQLVVTAVTLGALEAYGIGPGMIVNSVDGVAAKTALEREMALVSGSPQWKQYRAEEALRTAYDAGERTLALQDAAGQEFEVVLPLNRVSYQGRVQEPRPEGISELEPGIVYVDIGRLTDEMFAEAKSQIETAEALVFDLRGYPRGGTGYLAHMTDQQIRSAEMNVPIQTQPDAQFDEWREGGWIIEAALPRYTDKIVFITDGSAVSYSESILGTVKANRLGTIIGGPTAGANGNVTTFKLPGGYQLRWTGMLVVNRDGTQHHIFGVQPDIPVERTLVGVREGRDELLEAALIEVKRQIDKE